MERLREQDEFDRIQVSTQIAKDRLMITQYEEGLEHRRARVENNRYELGRLDERLRGAA